MKINNLKINAFGNLENKEINLSEHINIIRGKNESGKSTLMKFIIDMFYGISKNKRGKEFSDYDKFKPWNTEEFSGKITYTLDDGKKYEVFRDFNKKNPKIYNEEAEEISKDFKIDKTNGNQFFIEQTKLDEEMFLASLVSMQQEVRLEKNVQNTILQKVANYVGTGDDNISYKKAIDKLNKKQVEEIGTIRTQGRPINLIKDEKYKLQDEIGDMEQYKEQKYEIENQIEKIEEEISQNENRLNIFKDIQQMKDRQKIEKEKILINENIIKTNNEKISLLDNQKKDLESKINNEKKGKNKHKNITNILLLIVLFILIVTIVVMNKNKIALLSCSILAIIDLILIVTFKIKINKRNKIKEDNTSKIKKEIDTINTQIEIIEKNNEQLKQNIKDKNDLIILENNNLTKDIKNKYKEIENIEEITNLNNINNEIEKINDILNREKLQLHTIEIDKKNIVEKLEKLAAMEERLEQLNEQEKILIKNNESIELAKEILEIAYKKMKENVTPKFTQKLSENINKISDGKYKNVKINDEEGIIVEKNDGEYISAEKLSVGTIDQLYMSLRFATINEVSKENMPIILDESFAYYDEKRLENILKYMNQEYKDRQIIIFTCTNREKDILERENIKYSLIEM